MGCLGSTFSACLSQQLSSPWHLGAGCSWGVQKRLPEGCRSCHGTGKRKLGLARAVLAAVLAWAACPAGMQIPGRQIPCRNTSHTWCPEPAGLTSLCVEREPWKCPEVPCSEKKNTSGEIVPENSQYGQLCVDVTAQSLCHWNSRPGKSGQGAFLVGWWSRERLRWWGRQTQAHKALVLSRGSQ